MFNNKTLIMTNKIIISTIILFFVLFSCFSLYTFYGILSATMYSSDIVVSSDKNATSQVITPCLINTINGSCDSYVNYILINTTDICSGTNIFGERNYPEEMCINDNKHCVNYFSYENGFYCPCLTNANTQYLMNQTNYLLIYIIVVSVITIFLIIFVTFFLAILFCKRCQYYWRLKEENGEEEEENEDPEGNLCFCIISKDEDKDDNKDDNDYEENIFFPIAILIIASIIVAFIIVSIIVIPILLYTGIANPLCDYVHNDCYHINFELNAVISLTCYPYSYYDSETVAAYILLVTIIVGSFLYPVILIPTLFFAFKSNLDVIFL